MHSCSVLAGVQCPDVTSAWQWPGLTTEITGGGWGHFTLGHHWHVVNADLRDTWGSWPPGQQSTWAPILGPGSASQHAVTSVLAPDQQILLFVFWSLMLFHIKSIHENILDMKYTPASSNISSSGVIFFQSTSMFYKRISILVLLFQILILAVTSKKRDIQEEVCTMQWNMIILIRFEYKYPLFAWGTEEQSTFKGIFICWKKKCQCIFRTRKQVKK